MPRIRLLILVVITAVLTACAKPEEKAANYVKSAQALFDQGDLKKAGIEARNALQIQPKNAQARFILARVAGKDGNFKEMYGNLLIAVESDPGLVPARLDLGTLLVLSGNPTDAGKQADAVAALAPDDPGLHVLRARLLIAAKDGPGARQELDRALAQQPTLRDAVILKAGLIADLDPDAALQTLDAAIAGGGKADNMAFRTMRASILLANKRLVELEADYQSLAKDYPADAQIQNDLASFYGSQGRLDDAERTLRAFIAQDPKSADTRINLVRFLTQYRSPEAAEAALKGFIAELPDALSLQLFLGQIYELTFKLDDALTVYEGVAKASPTTGDGIKARVRMGSIYLQQGRNDTGRSAIEGVLKDVSDNADALLMRANWLVVDGKFDDAIADIRSVLRSQPNNRQAMLLLARTYGVSKQAPLAKDAYRQLLTADPTNAEAPRELALLEAQGGDTAAAEQILRTRLAVDAKDVSSKALMIDLLLGSRNPGAAEAAAREMVAGGDASGAGELRLAQALQAQGKFPEAIEAFKRVLEKDSRQTTALDGLVESYLALGRKDEAIAQAEASARAAPDNLAVTYTLARAYGAAGRLKDAVPVFEKLAKQRPDVTGTWTAWAELYPNDLEKRLAVFRKGLAIVPDSQELAMQIGQELEMARRFADAIAHYEKFLKANPTDATIANNLAALLLDQRSDKASHARALDLVKGFGTASNPAFLDTLGWAQFRNGDFLQAATVLERAVIAADEQISAVRKQFGDEMGAQLARQLAPFHYHLAMAYLASQNKVGARQELVKALVDPQVTFAGSDEARAELAKLGQASPSP